MCTMGIIYILTSPNGKRYVGQTRRTLKIRLDGHKSASANPNKAGCRCLNAALRKHGWENFTNEILWEGDDNLLDDKEIEYIVLYNTLVPHGYNLQHGGCSGSKSDDTKQKMKTSALARDASVYRRFDETKALPKYIGRWGQKGYKIAKHPKCKCKYFSSENTQELNLAKALEFLELLNTTSLVVINIPRGNIDDGLIHRLGDGSSRAKLRIGTTVFSKTFSSKLHTPDENFQLASEYLLQLKQSKQEDRPETRRSSVVDDNSTA